MMEEYEITVLITSYNSALYLRKAFTSVFHQTLKTWKIVLVDDASTDHSLETIQDYLQDPRVTLIRNSENVGQSKSMNKALEYIDTPLFLQLDSDDWLAPEALQLFVEEHKKVAPDVAILTSNVVHVYEDKDGNIIRQEKKITKTKEYKDRYDIVKSFYIPYPRCFRTSIMKQMGGWPVDDPYEGRHVEDLRIFLLLIENYRFHWMHHYLYYYRLHEHNSTNNRVVIAEAVEYIIRDALKRWNDEYEPTFGTTESGWKFVADLIPKNKK